MFIEWGCTTVNSMEHKLEIGIFWTWRRIMKGAQNGYTMQCVTQCRMEYKLIFCVQKFAERIVSPSLALFLSAHSHMLASVSGECLNRTSFIHSERFLWWLPFILLGIFTIHKHSHTLRAHIIYDIFSFLFCSFLFSLVISSDFNAFLFNISLMILIWYICNVTFTAPTYAFQLEFHWFIVTWWKSY